MMMIMMMMSPNKQHRHPMTEESAREDGRGLAALGRCTKKKNIRREQQ